MLEIERSRSADCVIAFGFTKLDLCMYMYTRMLTLGDVSWMCETSTCSQLVWQQWRWWGLSCCSSVQWSGYVASRVCSGWTAFLFSFANGADADLFSSVSVVEIEEDGDLEPLPLLSWASLPSSAWLESEAEKNLGVEARSGGGIGLADPSMCGGAGAVATLVLMFPLITAYIIIVLAMFLVATLVLNSSTLSRLINPEVFTSLGSAACK